MSQFIYSPSTGGDGGGNSGVKLGNYITGKWITGDGEGQPLYNAVNGDIITTATTKGFLLMRCWSMVEALEILL